MPSVSFGTSSYERTRGDLPSLPVINMFAEEAPTEEKGLTLQSRPGLEDRAETMGTGPVRALFQRNGVLGGALFGVSGTSLYRGSASLGVIDGGGVAQMAGYENYLFVTRGQSLWGYNGTSLMPVPFPDNANVLALTVGASRLVAIRRDTQKFYWSSPLGTDIDALSFASAEDTPDRLLDLLWVDDFLLLFGAETVEPWARSTDPDLPFSRLQGATMNKGIRNTGACCNFGPTFAWVTNDGTVCIQSESNVISNVGLQARIGESGQCLLFSILIDGDEYLALRLDNETQIYSTRSQRWSEFASHGHGNWLVGSSTGEVFGSALDGRTFRWSAEWLDDGDVLERRIRGGFPINSSGMTINNVLVRCNVGGTSFLTGDYAEPTMEMRHSRDAGKTWGNWRSSSLGKQGDYRTTVRWNACGMASQPAFLAEFRVTDPVDVRISDVLVNVPRGGR
jgi:hypothetical protein